MKPSKKIVPFQPRPMPLAERSQQDILAERKKKRETIVSKYRPKK